MIYTRDDIPETRDGVPFDLRMQAIEQDLHNIKETLELLKTYMVKADATIAAIAGEVKPTLDALTNNPMVKMFLKQGEKGAKK